MPFGIVYAAAYASMASLFSDSFDPTVRYSSISFVYQFSGIFASGLTPMIATMLVQANGSQPWYLCGYLLAAGILSTISTIWLGTLRERTDLLKTATASKTVVANNAADATVTDAAV